MSSKSNDELFLDSDLQSIIDYRNSQKLKTGDVIALLDENKNIYDFAYLLKDPTVTDHLPILRLKSQKTSLVFDIVLTDAVKKI